MIQEQAAINLARAYLHMSVDPGSRFDDDGLKSEAMALAFSTGIRVTLNTETWTPSPEHLNVGTANFKCAVEALESGNVTFTGDVSALVESAATDKAAFDACMLIFEAKLAQGEAIPPQLGQWAINGSRPRKGAHKNKPRDRAIVTAIYWLTTAHGMTATRNDGSPPTSACDIVAGAAHMSYEAVRKVWDKDRL